MRTAAALGLGIGDRGMSHGLLVLATPGRQRLADPMQSLADAGHVAVAEDRPDAREIGDFRPVDLDVLRLQMADQRLGGGEADRSNATRPRAA